MRKSEFWVLGFGGGVKYLSLSYLQALGNHGYSEILSDIIALGKCEVHCTKKPYSFCISQGLSQKGHNSVKTLQMISKFELDLYFMILYPSFNVEKT